MRKRATTLTGIASIVVLLLAGSAVADPYVEITSPTEGQSFSRTTTASLDISGIAEFDTPEQSDQVFYLRRDDCGGHDDNPHLSLDPGGPETDCGFVVDILGLSEVFTATEEYPAADGVPFTLDAARDIEGVLQISSFGTGQVKAEFELVGVTNRRTKKLGTAEAEALVLPARRVDLQWTMDVNDQSDKQDFDSLTLLVTFKGVSVMAAFTMTNGPSYFTLPIYSASFNRIVEVGIDNQPLTRATLSDDFMSWSASKTMPLPGTHVVKARALQGGAVSAVDQRTITVTD